MSDLDAVEQQLRIDQMTINIEKLRSDMAVQQRQLSWETRKFAVSLVVALAAALGAGAAVGNYLARLPQPAPPPQTIIIQQQPYTPPPGQPAR